MSVTKIGNHPLTLLRVLRVAPAGARFMTLGLVTCALGACAATDQAPAAGVEVNPETTKTLQEAAGVSVFFNHQSVGENILSGLDALTKKSGTAWSVVKLTPEAGQWPAQPGLWHAMLGENEKPKTKIDGFAHALRSWTGQKPKVAFLKLCFVDVTDTTDIPDLLNHYQATMTQLKSEFPNVVFGHVTVPLAPQPDTVKVKIKRLIGRRVDADLSNAARTTYNSRLRELFAKDPILDLERVQSTRPDGTRVQMNTPNGSAFGLAQSYASDPWGHLNDYGAQVAAVAFARFIRGAANTR